MVDKNNRTTISKIYDIYKKGIPKFWKPSKFRSMNCPKLLNEKSKFDYKNKHRRKTFGEIPASFGVSCDDIKKRGYYPNKSLSKEEEEFPLAYAINVYQDYLKLEMQFLVMYSPQNHYCYGIDKKSKPIFKRNVHALAKCFPNIYIVKNKRNLDTFGTNGNYYNFECMKLLKNKNYKYLILLQNDDTPLKTNLELVKILKIYNGTIDMNVGDPIAKQPIYLNSKKSLVFSSLKMFKKSDKRFWDKKLGNRHIKVQKGFLQSSIPKKTVDYILNEINIETLVDNLNTGKRHSDELLWPTIFTNPYLAVPGWQHYNCSSKSIFSKYYMTRKALFGESRKCMSGYSRHGVCVLGVEALSEIKQWPHFFANKFRSHFDAGALMCWLEYIYMKKYFLPFDGINENLYLSSPLIKYQKLKEKESNHTKICQLI
uniref:Capsular polysaccharide synthesis protein n=1 Tax=Strongyloides venezuelensis TaxID=75913 RepID=A0A0K0FTM9_STRVS